MTGGRAFFLSAVSVPFLVLFAQMIAWLRWGVDIPFVDDWRMFRLRDAGSLALIDLFRPANDTIYATGKILDALAVRWLGFNTVGYQLLSMLACLGSLLFLQFRLLGDAFADRRLLAAAFTANLFVLQTGGYWGYQSIAYHQAIPLVALLACLVIQLSGRLDPIVRIGLIAVLGTLGGMAYISGAFAFASAAVVSAIFSRRAGVGLKSKLRMGTVGFGIASLISLPVQLWVILVFQAGGTHRTDAGWAFPWEGEFWAFVLGMTSHAFAIQTSGPLVIMATIASGILLLALIVPVLLGLGKLFREKPIPESEAGADYVYTSLFAAVGLYVVMVAAGRTALAPGAPIDWSDTFIRGGVRFHFFWIAVLIPWALALWLRTIRSWVGATSLWPAAMLALTASILAFAWNQGALSYSAAYQQAADAKSTGVRCIQARLGAGEPIICPTIHPADLTDEIRFARGIGTSFTRYLYFSDPAPRATR